MIIYLGPFLSTNLVTWWQLLAQVLFKKKCFCLPLSAIFSCPKKDWTSTFYYSPNNFWCKTKNSNLFSSYHPHILNGKKGSWWESVVPIDASTFFPLDTFMCFVLFSSYWWTLLCLKSHKFSSEANYNFAGVFSFCFQILRTRTQVHKQVEGLRTREQVFPNWRIWMHEE